VTGYELSLSILYLLPILLATWTLGFSAGLMCSLVSLLAWLLSDAAMGHEYSRSLYHWWEGTIRIGTWLVFVLLLDRLRIALGMADERFVTVLAGLDAAVFVSEPASGELLYLNARCAEAFGSDLANEPAIRARLQGRGTGSGPLGRAGTPTELHDTRSDRWYLVARRSIRWIDGRAVELHIATDVTDRKRAEGLVQKQQERLEVAARLTTLGEMASILAHELNQPLAAIANYCKGTIRRLRSGEYEPSLLLGALEKGAAQAERAGRIVQRMRAVLLKRSPMPAPCDINAAITAVARLVEHDADRSGARIRVELAQALPQSLADPVMIELVLLNLIRNGLDSMQFTPGPLRELTIRSLPEDERFTRVEVVDHGAGLPAQLLEGLFMPFFTTKPDGLGMGLHICRSIIERHGGRIWASANPAGGTILHFTLPRLPS
jgi:signal transduction histidine kinase